MDPSLIFRLYSRKTILTILIEVIRIYLEQSLKSVAQEELGWEEEDLSEATREKCMRAQSDIMRMSVKHVYFVRYPMSPAYVLSFLRRYMRLLEETLPPWCVDVDIYTMYAHALEHCPAEDSSACYVSHTVNEISVAVLENRNVLAEAGTSGLRTWPAALFMAHYLHSQSEAMVKRNNWQRIIELGAGVGTLGIALRKTGFTRNRDYLFTDHKHSLLTQMAMNYQANGFETREFNACLLDWTQLEQHHLQDSRDLILATDVVFDLELIIALVKALKQLLASYVSPSGEQAQCFIAAAVRNQQTLVFFDTNLGEHGLRGQIIARREQPEWLEDIHTQMAKCDQSPKWMGSLSQLDGDIVPLVLYSICLI